MSLFESEDLTKVEREKLARIAQAFLLYFEIYTNKRTSSVSWEDSTEALFKSDRIIFGQVVLQLFSIFKIKAMHLPLTEFQEFPAVEDLILYIFRKAKF